MKYLLPLALVISMTSAAEDGWVAVGQAPTAKPATQTAPSAQSYSAPISAVSAINEPPPLQVELLGMVETMQQEIAELRGTVEEQSHTIEMLQKQQQQRYLDLDKRMSELMLKPTPKTVTNASGDLLSADDLYAGAMALIKKKDFTNALVQLDLFAKTYPSHKLAANAFYWSGEVQLAEGNYALAIKQFEQVVELHADHNKAPDSHYKLAVAYDRSGDSVKAKQILTTVIKLYKGKSDSVVRLANRYLKRLEAAN